MSGRQRSLLIVAAAAVVIVAFAIARSGGSKDKVAGKPQTVVVRDAKPVGGVRTLTWKHGQRIDLTVRSDTADEVHFHGYDVHKDVAKDGSVRFRIKATIEGKFVVELERHKQTLANVEVVP
jgi:hypothetical protein